jgi:glutamyl-tRNA synthetase
LFAASQGGHYLLRMEDTDRERFVASAVEQIRQAHAWLGLAPDEEATQSDRLAIYQKSAQNLVKTGKLYRCWCSPERLAQLREEATKQKEPYRYDRHCLVNPGDPAKLHVLRFQIPDEPRTIKWSDAVRDELSFEAADLDDFVALKSDGWPTYNFANVVDDHEMQISHVLRAEEFLPSTPKHLLLYQAFGWEPPTFGHLPQVLGADKTKLSKRHGAKSVLEYRDQGYLPEAVMNFAALLGWNPGEGSTQEIFSREELVQQFSLERIQKSPAVFDPERLDWMNGLYIRSLTLEELAQRAQNFWPTEAKSAHKKYLHQVLRLVQERLKYLGELPELTQFFFTDPQVDAANLPAGAQEWLKTAVQALEGSKFTPAALETTLRGLAGQLGLKTGPLFGALRLAVTGRRAAPGLFDTLSVLGQETVLRRLRRIQV